MSELKSRSEMKRVEAQSPGTLIAEIERLREQLAEAVEVLEPLRQFLEKRPDPLSGSGLWRIGFVGEELDKVRAFLQKIGAVK